MGSAPVGKVAIVLRGDAATRAAIAPANARLAPVFAALGEVGLAAEPAVYSDARATEVRDQLLAVDGVLVWVDPVTADGDRTVLDAVLREVAVAGTWVGAHPDVIAKMATKEVLYTTRDLGWGTDVHRYATIEEFRDQFPRRLAADRIRVLKPRRGNGGLGVWKVMVAEEQTSKRVSADTAVLAQHALVRDETIERLTLGELMARCEPAFAADQGTGLLIDQAFARRIDEGIIRAYMVKECVVGFARQYPKGLSPDELAAAPRRSAGRVVETIMGLPAQKTMYDRDEAAFMGLRERLEAEWVPAMQHLLDIEDSALPALWDADFLYGPVSPDGNDTHILCEINASSVIPFPRDAPAELARATLTEIAARSHGT
jgi:hypothetical protein